MNRDNIYSIAIDGPAGAGKSTVSKSVAKKLKIEYIDTGAMYRALTLKIIEKNVDITDEKKLKNLLNTTEIDFSNSHIHLDGKEVDKEIRRDDVTKKVSDVSAINIVREKMLDAQRNIAKNKSVIMDGRDIGTDVLTDAKYKFFLNASLHERAKRRYEEIKDRKITLSEVENDIKERDYKDINRAIAPLRKAEDAFEIDTTNMNIEEVINFIINFIKEKQ